MKEDGDLFSFLTQRDSTDPPVRGVWRILLVDDDEDVHTVTKMAISDMRFEERGLEFLHAYSGEEAKQILNRERDIALILLDVVMESEHAGLEVVEHVRNTLKDDVVRIVLRTGLAGRAPERDVIEKYDINDYKEKDQLTATRIYTTVLASLRAYRGLKTIETYNRDLESRIRERTADLRRKNRELESLERIIRCFNNETDFQRVVENLVNLTRISFPATHAVCVLFRESPQGGFQYISGSGCTRPAGELSEREVCSYLNELHEIEEGIYVSFPKKALEVQPAYLAGQHKAAMVVTMEENDCLVGLIGYHNHDDAHAFGVEDHRHLARISHHAVSAVFKSRLVGQSSANYNDALSRAYDRGVGEAADRILRQLGRNLRDAQAHALSVAALVGSMYELTCQPEQLRVEGDLAGQELNGFSLEGLSAGVTSAERLTDGLNRVMDDLFELRKTAARAEALEVSGR